MGDTFSVIVGFIVVIISPFVLGLCLTWVLDLIKNSKIRKIMTVVFFILFLPAMLAVWNSASLTEHEKKWVLLSYNLRSRSRLILVTYFAYVCGYYMLLTKIL